METLDLKHRFTKHIVSIFPTWLLIIFNFSGFLPLKLTDSGFQFIPWSALVSVSLITSTTTTLTYITITNPPIKTSDPVKNLVNIVKAISIFLGAILIEIFNIIVSRNGEFISIITYICEVEPVFTSKGFKVPRRNFINRVTLFILGFLLVLIPMSIAANQYERLVKSLTYVGHFYIVLMLILFIRLAEGLSQSFVRLNTMIKLGVILAGFVPSSETPKITLEEIREVHYKLCKAIEGINSFFGIQLICLFAYIFVLAVINPYYIVDGLIRPPSSGFDKFMIVKQISWCLFAVTLLISITWVSTYTTYHAKRTGFHVSCLLSLDLLPETRNKVKLALMQISNNTCEFSVLDLFKINTTNITSFAGMAVTYFIVILQFESSNKH